MQRQFMVQPSSLIASGVKLSEFGDIYLFRFTSQLQSRLEELLEKKKASSLTSEEEAEYAGISDLERIFTFINAQLATKAQWCPIKLDNLYDDELNTSVNTATPQNI